MEKKEQQASPKIYGAIAAIMKETKAIGKTEKNLQQNFMFRGIDSVMNELHDIFAKQGVFILPEVLDYNVSEKVTGKGTLMYYTRAKVKYHFTAEDASEVCTINVGEAMDSGDKGMNKAMSIALKYALMQMLLIPTKEDKDPDKTTPEETVDPMIGEALAEMRSATDEETLKEVYKKWKGIAPALCSNGSILYRECQELMKRLKTTQKTA